MAKEKGKDKDKKHREKKRRLSNAASSDEMAVENEEIKDQAKGQPARVEDSHENDIQVSFKTAEDVAGAVNTVNVDLLIQGFTHLREHLRICNRPDSADTPVQARILQESCRRVIYEWAAMDNGDFGAVSAAWQLAYSQNIVRLEALIPSTVAGLLAALDTPDALRFGNKLVQQVLGEHIRAVTRAFGTPRSSTCASVLQLLYQVVVFSHGEYADQMWHAFNWTMSSLDLLPSIRSNVMGFSIRRLWTRYVLSFFTADRCKSFVEVLRTRKIFSSLFNGVERDSYQELHALLSSVYLNVVLNEEVPRADKVRVFGVHLMGRLAKLADNAVSVDPRQVGIPNPQMFVPRELSDTGANTVVEKDSISGLIMRFFKGMMTFPGYGICFHQYGLYPAPRRWNKDLVLSTPGAALATEAATAEDKNENDNDNDNDGGMVPEKEHDFNDTHDVAVISKNTSLSGMRDLCNSQILRILVGCINPASTKRMGDLAIEILRASPELIAPFWRNYSCSFEPRLSLRYLGNTAFAMKVMGLPLPLPADTQDSLRYAEPPRLNALIEHVLPFPLLRTCLGRGLQMRSSPLVRYRNLLLIDLALRKLSEVREWIQAEARSSGSQSAEMSAWTKLDRRLLTVVKQRIPEWKVVMTLHNEINAAADSTSIPDTSEQKSEEALRELKCQHALLDNVLMKVIHGYQMHFSDLVMEANFEFGKLISDIRLSDVLQSNETTDGTGVSQQHDPIKAHTLLYLLHALSTTPASSIKWMTRVKAQTTDDSGLTTSQHTNIGVIIMIYLFAVQPDLRLAARKVCLCALRSTGLFDHDTGNMSFALETALSEASCWLDALAAIASPHANRNKPLTAIAEDGVKKGHALVAFLEEALGHASRLSYKYADRVYLSAVQGNDSSGHIDNQLPFSPLLSAVTEAAVLKVASGNGALATRLQGQSPLQIFAEMQTNSMFAYIREVVCRIAEIRGQETARCLNCFLSAAANLTLAPRLAKLDTAKDVQKAKGERIHYGYVEKAFLDAFSSTQSYLMIIGSQHINACDNAVPRNLPSISFSKEVSKKLRSGLDHACGDIGARLLPFIDEMTLALHENSNTVTIALLTEWLLSQAETLEGGARQSVFMIAISWISHYERVSAQNRSLWDLPVFAALSSEILQIDDMSFLLAMFRHLLASKSLPLLISKEPAQRLLVHILLANSGSIRFCSFVSRLLQRVVIATQCISRPEKLAETQIAEFSSAASFVFALTATHLNSLSEKKHHSQLSYQLGQALEIHATTFNINLLHSAGGRELQRILDFNTAILARRSTQVWVSIQEARRVWQSFALRVAKEVSASVEGSNQPTTTVAGNTNQIDLSTLICVTSPAMTDTIRADVLQTFSHNALNSNASLDLCAMTNAVFTLLDHASSDIVSVGNVDIPRLKSVLSSKVIDLWSRSLGSDTGEVKEALEWTAQFVTKHAGPSYSAHSASSLVSDSSLCQQIKRTKLQLSDFDKAYSSGGVSIDIASMADHLYQRAGTAELYAEDIGKYHILALVISNDATLRYDAYKWAEAAFGDKDSNIANVRFVVWLLNIMAQPYVRETAFGSIVWDDVKDSHDIRALCLRVGGQLVAAVDPTQIGGLMDSKMMFLLDVVIQCSDDLGIVDQVCHNTNGLDRSTQLLVKVHVMRSRALRYITFPHQIGSVVESAGELFALAQEIIPALGDDIEDAEQTWKLVSVLAGAIEHCWCTFNNKSATMSPNDGLGKTVAGTIDAAFSCIGNIIQSICYSFADSAEVETSVLEQYARFYPAPVFRFLAFALRAVDSLSKALDMEAVLTKHPWFSLLKCLLDCRLFSDRVYRNDLRSSITLIISALWDLASPAIPRWSASLDDYLTLDQLESLVGAFGGSCSLSDNVLLHVISSYERQSSQSVQRVALCFGPVAAEMYTKEKTNRARYLIKRDENDIGLINEDVLSNALATVDSIKLFRTLLNFSTQNAGLFAENPVARLVDIVRLPSDESANRGADTAVGVCDSPSNADVYSSWYLLSWTWSIVSSGHQVDMRKFIDCNAAGFALVSLSSENMQIRKLAYFILDRVCAIVEESKWFVGQRQCALLLDSVRNTITSEDRVNFPKLPFTATLFAATSLHTMIRPEHIMYTEINRLLLQGPCLRMTEMPLLRTVLHSSNSTYKQRIHILRLVSQSSRSFDQCRVVFGRSRLVNTLLALASSSLGDVQTARSTMTLLFHLTSASNPEALTGHVSKKEFSLLAWIREQITLELNAMRQMAGMAYVQSQSTASSTDGLLTSTARAINASIVNVTALLRIVIRAIANYPLTQLREGSLVYNSFWVLKSQDQAAAAGQCAALGLVQQIMHGVVWSLSRTMGCVERVHNEIVGPTLVLVRTCLEITMLLADLQSCASSEHPGMLESSEITHGALAALGMLESALDCNMAEASVRLGSLDGISRVRYDPCGVAAIASAQMAESLFQTDMVLGEAATTDVPESNASTVSMLECYRQCVDRLFLLCFSFPWTTTTHKDVAEVVSRALVVNAPSSLQVSSWIRECKS
ncbi:hypothetical protein H4S06_000298 [Coemansia sp. BCRC 34490]|nr:hypothetical protein H4S06_000298 [Coemansia sp. BCRC 34490]